jgi:hypothetical protein
MSTIPHGARNQIIVYCVLMILVLGGLCSPILIGGVKIMWLLLSQ